MLLIIKHIEIGQQKASNRKTRGRILKTQEGYLVIIRKVSCKFERSHRQMKNRSQSYILSFNKREKDSYRQKKEASFFVMRSTFCTFVLRKQESLQSHETPTTDTIHLACPLRAGITRDRHARTHRQGCIEEIQL